MISQAPIFTSIAIYSMALENTDLDHSKIIFCPLAETKF